jgi:hypothetical protein
MQAGPLPNLERVVTWEPDLSAGQRHDEEIGGIRFGPLFALLCATVPTMLAKGFLAVMHYRPSLRINDLFEVAISKSINDPNLAHPSVRFSVEIIAGEALNNRLTFPPTLKFVPKRVVRNERVCEGHRKHSAHGRSSTQLDVAKKRKLLQSADYSSFA